MFGGHVCVCVLCGSTFCCRLGSIIPRTCWRALSIQSRIVKLFRRHMLRQRTTLRAPENEQRNAKKKKNKHNGVYWIHWLQKSELVEVSVVQSSGSAVPALPNKTKKKRNEFRYSLEALIKVNFLCVFCVWHLPLLRCAPDVTWPRKTRMEQKKNTGNSVEKWKRRTITLCLHQINWTT